MVWNVWQFSIVALLRGLTRYVHRLYRCIQTERFSRGMIVAVDLVSEVYSLSFAISA